MVRVWIEFAIGFVHFLVVHLLNLPAKFDTDDGLEEVVDDFDEVGRVDDETGLQVLPISKNNCLNSIVNN